MSVTANLTLGCRQRQQRREQLSMSRMSLVSLQQRQRLEEEQQKALADLDRKAELLRQGEGRQAEAGKGASDQGKLDQILERLGRIEKRLDQLENGQPKAQPKAPKGRK